MCQRVRARVDLSSHRVPHMVVHFDASLSRDIAFPAALSRSPHTQSMAATTPPCRTEFPGNSGSPSPADGMHQSDGLLPTVAVNLFPGNSLRQSDAKYLLTRNAQPGLPHPADLRPSLTLRTQVGRGDTGGRPNNRGAISEVHRLVLGFEGLASRCHTC